MTEKQRQTYLKKSLPALTKIAQDTFNKYIRFRDSQDQGSFRVGKCISSGRFLKVPSPLSHAGHYIPVGHCSALRFNEDNCHLQSMTDNYFKHGHQIKYRRNLVLKIGEDRVQALEDQAADYKRNGHKWSRLELIEIIATYREKLKALT